MATANRPSDATISNDALSLLSCFCDGIDEVILRIAEAIARAANAPSTPAPEISAQNIIDAGNRLAHILKTSTELDDDTKAAVDIMLQCVQRKATTRHR